MSDPSRRAAQKQLEEAIEALTKVDETFPDGEVLVGYTLIVCGTRYTSPELDEDYEDAEEDDMVSLYAGFVRPGQHPALTRGMVESYLDRFRND